MKLWDSSPCSEECAPGHSPSQINTARILTKSHSRSPLISFFDLSLHPFGRNNDTSQLPNTKLNARE
jgi:hypothetical protein